MLAGRSGRTFVVLEPERTHLNEPIGARGVRYRGFYVSSTSLPECENDAPFSAHVIRNRRRPAIR